MFLTVCIAIFGSVPVERVSLKHPGSEVRERGRESGEASGAWTGKE